MIAKAWKECDISGKTLKRYANTLLSALNDNAPEITIQRRYEDFKSSWLIAQDKHREYYALIDNDIAMLKADEWICELSELFGDAEIKSDIYLDRLTENRENGHKLARDNERKNLREQEKAKFKLCVDQITTLIKCDTEDKSYISNAVKEMQRNLDNIMSKCEEITISNIANDVWMQELLATYNQVKVDSILFVSKYGTPIIDTSREKQNGIKLAKLHFDPFDGDIRKYPVFKNEFNRYIKPLYSEEELAFVLKSYLVVDVRADVAHLVNDVNAMWERLDSKYGCTHKLVDDILADIKHLNVNSKNSGEVLHMISVIERAHRDLKCLGLEQEMSNSTIISIIEKQLPTEILDEWIKIVVDSKESRSSKFTTLMQFLAEVRRRLEYTGAPIRASEERNRKYQYSSTAIGTCNYSQQSQEYVDTRSGIKSTSRVRCAMHPQDNTHLISKCEIYENADAYERVRLAKSYSLCFSCLEKGHVAKYCRKRFSCQEAGCQLSHNRLLHEAYQLNLIYV